MKSFDFVSKKNKKKNEAITEETIVEKPIWSYIKELYSIISDSNENNIKSNISKFLAELPENEYGFICWAINHYLIYNDFTKDNIDLFTTTSYWLRGRDYIEWYMYFMNKNKVKFPKFMSWYRMDINGGEKKYITILKELYKLSDDDIVELSEYCNSKGLSLREVCIDLNYC